ncbi:hypothetical protein K2173_019588 [Erythroxylum novogranatense]|uniref:RING-type E3 ubiquitin transferase n=1 Tax=Erythroxylum novogranatense TaxID=1862640 RepID=A0AAV8UBS8_9ROSI|nr:hypothetical protein K2173_019588 [Erythroxylum novogranatense]
MVMEHRNFLNAPQMFENEQDQEWNHAHLEQSYNNMAGSGSAENAPFYFPVENIPVDGVHFTSPWSSAPNAFLSSNHSVEGSHYQPDTSGPSLSHYQPDTSGPSHDPFHPSPAGNFCAAPDNYAHHASSSNYERQTMHGIEGSFVDLTMGNGRGPHKRKSPGIPSSCERGSTSRYYGVGSSSDLPLSLELREEKPNLGSQCMPWEHFTMNPSYRGNLSFRAESSTRNVRSRPTLDTESNLARTHFPGIHSHVSFSASHPVDHHGSLEFPGQSSSASTHEWSHARMSPPPGRIIPSDTGGFSHETNHFPAGNSAINASVDVRGYQHDFISRRNSVSQSPHVTSTHSERGIRSSHSQRPSPNFRASSSSLRLGHIVPSDDNLQLVAESYSSRQPRQLSTPAWRSGDRNGRSRISHERYRSLSSEACLHERFSSEGFMVVERSHFYGSRNMFDQHREMRLDIDNMSYEELLALGERIGHVNTGLSEDLMSKCLTETVHYSLDQKEGSCVICLEEYKNMDDIGALSSCGHDYHISCIKKWLSMKNSCPICKTAALEDK